MFFLKKQKHPLGGSVSIYAYQKRLNQDLVPALLPGDGIQFRDQYDNETLEAMILSRAMQGSYCHPLFLARWALFQTFPMSFHVIGFLIGHQVACHIHAVRQVLSGFSSVFIGFLLFLPYWLLFLPTKPL
jgi:hypothetical protein